MSLSSDNLAIDTPEQIALEFVPAGIGSRLLAMALDSLIQAALYFLILLGAFLLLTRTRAGQGAAAILSASTNWAMALVVLVLFTIYWGYFAAFEAWRKGQTPGKWALGIRVIKDNGRPINAVEAIGRNILRAVDSLPALYGVGLVCMALTRKNQRLGDLVAGTVVVHERAQAPVSVSWIAERGRSAVPLLSSELARLDNRDLELVETFLHRREELQGFVRMKAADQILAHLREKTGISPEPGEGPEAFLERMARTLRDRGR
ncbi:MAG: RDD family protein [Acidobacteria bacterium]|nr:RDD family protein [Acidobacteriota bacterium]